MRGVYENAIERIRTEGKGSTYHTMSEEDMRTWAGRTENQLDRAARDLNEAGYPGDAIIKRYRELAASYRAGTWPEGK